jgi:hypothetical protein
LDIDEVMDNRLGAVDQHPRARPTRQLYHRLHRHPASGDIAHMRHRDDPGARSDEVAQTLKIQRPIVQRRRKLQHHPFALA